jgi:O-antigen ligase
MSRQWRAAVVPVYLILILLLGGASAAGFFANMLLQWLAIPIIGGAILTQRTTPMSRASRQLVFIALLLLALLLIQILPLPPAIWMLFPGRGEIIEGYQALGIDLPWLPISVVPNLTVASTLWLLPALAVLLGITRIGAFRPLWIAAAIIGVTIAAIAWGAVQRSGNDAAYIYEITNYGVATGFFSNANHLATLLMVAMPFIAAVYLAARGRSRSAQRDSALLVLLVGAIGVMVVGIAINGSLAGIGLSVPVLAASGLMLLSRKRKIPFWAPIPLILITVVGLFVIFSRPLGNNLTTADARVSPISRYTSFSNTLSAARDFFPIGSGAGSFNTIYPMYEEPSTMTTTYVNHAHSDIIEIALDMGLPGLLLLALFLVWWFRRAAVIWRAPEPDEFARAATIATAAIIAHSLVDYPLRTAAISATFAACCALMAEPRPFSGRREVEKTSKARHLSAD